MHHIHTTPGFIIQGRPYGEAGKMITIFTRDFGLITAVAQGIRLEKSKLRYHTQDCSFGMYSLVKGKEYWRLTSAQGVRSKDDQRVEATKQNKELIARIALLLKRLLQGEEAHSEVFDVIKGCLDFTDENTGMSPEQLNVLESLTVARMLHWLGYIGSDAELKECLANTDVTVALLESLASKRKLLNQHINKALRESQL